MTMRTPPTATARTSSTRWTDRGDWSSDVCSSDLLEFFGLQGRYIYWAAATAGGAVAGFILGYCIFGFVAGLVLLVLAVAVGGVLIVMKQRKGLHSKKSDNGIFIYAYSKKV